MRLADPPPHSLGRFRTVELAIRDSANGGSSVAHSQVEQFDDAAEDDASSCTTVSGARTLIEARLSAAVSALLLITEAATSAMGVAGTRTQGCEEHPAERRRDGDSNADEDDPDRPMRPALVE